MRLRGPLLMKIMEQAHLCALARATPYEKLKQHQVCIEEMAVIQVCVHSLYQLMIIPRLLTHKHVVDEFKAAAAALMECLVLQYVALNDHRSSDNPIYRIYE